MKKFEKKIYCSLLVILSILSSAAQTRQTEATENTFNASNPNKSLQEKIFVHTDKIFYVAGEIIWFKIYDVAAGSLKQLNLSNIVYVELLNAQQKSIMQATIALDKGTGHGSLFLPSSINSGNYVFRAYTNWMKNFGADLFFQKTITIVNTLKTAAKEIAKDSEHYDISFFAEGGDLVNGIQSKLAFKLTDKYGRGVDCSGTILDQNNQMIVSFSSLKFGMGSFYFKPELNNKYRAVVNIKNRSIVKVLPVVYEKGYVMHLSGANNEQLFITVNSNSAFHQPVYLFAYSANNIKSVLMQVTDDSGKAVFTINKQTLAYGISHIVILNNRKQPVCERLVFKKPGTLQLNITADKQIYKTRDEANMAISASDNGKAAIADMSLGVYLIDSLQFPDENNIISYLWLTSELKGHIESPQYYFSNTTAESNEALENLLLTQGWSRFNFDEATRNPRFNFIPEHEGHIITGKVTDKTSGLPASNIRVYLSVPGEHFRFTSSVSDGGGNVFFDIKDFYGSGELVVQTGTQDSTYRVEIADPFSKETGNWFVPPFSFSESQLNSLASHSVSMQVQNAYRSNQLNKFLAPLLDSLAFYGKPDNKYFLDDYVRFNTMEEVLREYISGVDVRIHQGNYTLRMADPRNHAGFETDPLVLVDGVPVFDMNKVIAYNPLKIKKAEVVTRRYYLNSLTANGIVSYSTYKGDLEGFRFDSNSVELAYDGLQFSREFYSPAYLNNNERQNRIPDYRNVLLWVPQLQTDRKGHKQIPFYTSDIKGRYVAVIQGINADGKAGYGMVDFEVR